MNGMSVVVSRGAEHKLDEDECDATPDVHLVVGKTVGVDESLEDAQTDALRGTRTNQTSEN